jgi:hypothetical protein
MMYPCTVWHADTSLHNVNERSDIVIGYCFTFGYLLNKVGINPWRFVAAMFCVCSRHHSEFCLRFGS